jgi:hypothetical protein
MSTINGGSIPFAINTATYSNSPLSRTESASRGQPFLAMPMHEPQTMVDILSALPRSQHVGDADGRPLHGTGGISLCDGTQSRHNFTSYLSPILIDISLRKRMSAGPCRPTFPPSRSGRRQALSRLVGHQSWLPLASPGGDVTEHGGGEVVTCRYSTGTAMDSHIPARFRSAYGCGQLSGVLVAGEDCDSRRGCEWRWKTGLMAGLSFAADECD